MDYRGDGRGSTNAECGEGWGAGEVLERGESAVRTDGVGAGLDVG